MKTPTTILFHESRPEINIRITASINQEGNLLIEGYDSGKLVEELRGDLDYEYNMMVKIKDKESLKAKLSKELKESLTDDKLLIWLKDNYSHNEAFSAIEFLFDRLSIKYESFFWR